MSGESNSRILPGSRLLQITAKYFNQAAAEMMLMPIIADLQHESCNEPHGTITRWFILLRGYWNFWMVVGLLGLADRKANMRTDKSICTNALAKPGTQTLWIGIASILLLVLVWLALDDITTDSASGPFAFEYLFLVICGMWFAAVAIWLLVRRRALAGIVSLFAVALAVVAFWSLPHHYAPVSPVNYWGLFSLAWFLGVAVWMVSPPGRRGGKHTLKIL